ncbi:MAG: dockerin type I domain-containing protein [Ruminococcus sp.]|nr:dockerin type I domain-containing protein [Ruminococcus sp.]
MTAKKKILQLGLGVAAAALLAAVQPCSASAQEVLFAETIQVERYTGTFQKEFHIDIDGDGEKEAIGYYYVGSPNQYPISGIYSISDNGSEPYILYNRTANQRENCKIHIIQDKNTNETFIGYNTIVTNRSDSLYRLYSDNQSKLIINYRAEIDDSNKLEAYKTYMKNVDFLDEMAYGHGDVDGDADVTVSDAVSILSYYAATAAGQSPSFTEPQKKAADFNQDGMISVEDAVETLSLYAEHAAGIIDTVLLPANIRRDSSFGNTNVATDSNPFPLKEGTLESTFYLDIDNDGKKETVGQYNHINTVDHNQVAMDRMFQVYDNGVFHDSYGATIDNMNFWKTMLVYDHNIDKAYLINYWTRPAAMYAYAVLEDIYPSYNQSNWGICVSSDSPRGSHSNTAKININGKEATEQELYDYMNQVEFISDPEEKEDILNQFKEIITIY